ncbi:MAG: hypothetical protein ACK4TA_00095 [Saprospiraceae bacterium]
MNDSILFSAEVLNALLAVLSVGIPVRILFRLVNKSFKSQRQVKLLQKELNNLNKD